MSGLNEEQIEKLRGTLSTPGWRDVIFPALEARRQLQAKMAVTLPHNRPEPYRALSDQTVLDIVRGELSAIEWTQLQFVNEVRVYDENRRRDELARHMDDNSLRGEPVGPGGRDV